MDSRTPDLPRTRDVRFLGAGLAVAGGYRVWGSGTWHGETHLGLWRMLGLSPQLSTRPRVGRSARSAVVTASPTDRASLAVLSPRFLRLGARVRRAASAALSCPQLSGKRSSVRARRFRESPFHAVLAPPEGEDDNPERCRAIASSP